MGQVFVDISISLDGFVAGPNPGLEHPLGEGGEGLHEWAIRSATWRERHGLEGGTTGPDDEMSNELLGTAGAVVMGKGMFGGGDGPWGDPAWGETPWEGWWGDDPPFHMPVFVLTHHAREPLTLSDTTFTFVTDGIESALEQAKAAAGDKDVMIGGGADVINQYLAAGLVDELDLHVVPLLLGGGARLFEGVGPSLRLAQVRAVEAPVVTHLKYRVLSY